MIRHLAAWVAGIVVVGAIAVGGGIIRTDTTDAARHQMRSALDWLFDRENRNPDALVDQHVTVQPVDNDLTATTGTLGTSAHATVTGLLGRIATVDTLTSIAGYERSCSAGKGCVFGPAWNDNTDAPLSKNGCDTRNDVLRQQLSDTSIKSGTHGCKVIGGELDPDPYTGQTIALTHRGSVSTITIDHVFALQRAWNLGAAKWPLRQRETFANDPGNLIAVDASANSAKGSRGIDEWLPPNAAFRCTYVIRYLTVAANYHLPITAADRAIATRTC